MRHSTFNHTAVIAGAVAALAVLALAYPFADADTPRSEIAVDLGGQFEASRFQVADALAYQCSRDFHHCLKTIPNSTVFSRAAYDIEYGSCCSNLGMCKILVDGVEGGERATIKALYESACPSEDPVADAVSRRAARLEALNAQPEPLR